MQLTINANGKRCNYSKCNHEYSTFTEKLKPMVYRVELTNIKKQIRIVKKLVKKCHRHDDIVLVDTKHWIFKIPVSFVKKGYHVAMTLKGYPLEVVEIKKPPSKQEDFLKHPNNYRYMCFEGEEPHLYHIDTKVYFYPEYSRLSKKDFQRYVHEFINDYSSISIDILREHLQFFLQKIEHLELKENRRTSLGNNQIRLVFRMPFWVDSTLFKTERRMRHAQKTKIYGAPRIRHIPHQEIIDNCKYTNRTRISNVEHAEIFKARKKFGGGSIRRTK